MDTYLDSDDIAARLGIRRATVHRYRHRGDIPPPDTYLGRTPVWLPETIDDWIAARPSATWRQHNCPAP